MHFFQDVQVCSFFRTEPSSTSLEPELKAVRSRLEVVEKELAESLRQLSSYQEQNTSLKDENERVKKDQEDLLVLLADQDSQVLKYKERLKFLGQTVSPYP
jgi:chromosome segregation ATPase